MLHRHLTHQQYTLAAIDDVIARGKRPDWAALRRVVLDDRAMLEKVLRVCQAQVADPYAQRYHFWSSMPNDTLPDWEQVLAAAAHL